MTRFTDRVWGLRQREKRTRYSARQLSPSHAFQGIELANGRTPQSRTHRHLLPLACKFLTVLVHFLNKTWNDFKSFLHKYYGLKITLRNLSPVPLWTPCLTRSPNGAATIQSASLYDLAVPIRPPPRPPFRQFLRTNGQGAQNVLYIELPTPPRKPKSEEGGLGG